MGNSFNYYKKNQYIFIYDPVMKTERHISLVHLHLLLPKFDSFFRHFLFAVPPLWKNHFSFAGRAGYKPYTRNRSVQTSSTDTWFTLNISQHIKLI